MVPRPLKIESSREEIPLPLMKLDPLSSLSGQSLTISNYVSKRKKRRSRWKKHRHGGKPLDSNHHASGMSPAFGHHDGDKPLASANHVGGIIPIFGNHVGMNHLANGNHGRTSIIFDNPMLKWKRSWTDYLLQQGHYA